jgi:hypothetical protein
VRQSPTRRSSRPRRECVSSARDGGLDGAPFQLEDLGRRPNPAGDKLDCLLGRQELVDLRLNLVEARALRRSGCNGPHDIAAGEVRVGGRRPAADVEGGEGHLGLTNQSRDVVDRVRKLPGPLRPAPSQLVLLDGFALGWASGQRCDPRAVRGGDSLHRHLGLDDNAALAERSTDSKRYAGHLGDSVPIGLVEQTADVPGEGVAE